MCSTLPRRFRSWVAIFIVPGLLCSEPARAAGPGADEVNALYAKRFTFDRRGIPLISIRIVEGQSQVAVSATGGVRLLPQGVGTEVLGVGRWTVDARGRIPASPRGDAYLASR